MFSSEGKKLMTRRLYPFVFVSLIVIAMAGTWYWVQNKNPLEYLNENEFSFRTEDDWTAICISSAYEYPDQQRQGFGGGPCWGDKATPADSVYITYLMKDGTCRRGIVEGWFLSERESITRCYSRIESKDWRFSKTNGILQVEIGDRVE